MATVSVMCASLASCRIAVAKKRKFATARGMSRMRASVSGLPLSFDSSSASSSKFFSIRSASFSSSVERSAAVVRDHAGNARFAACTASSTSRPSLSGICAITSSVEGLTSSRYAPERGGAKLPPMKLATRNELLRIELPPVDIRIPRVPRHDRVHPLAQLRRDDLGHDERLLPPQLVRVAELEAEHAEDVAGDVPRRLRVPAVRDLHHHAEAVGVFGVLDGEAEEAV